VDFEISFHTIETNLNTLKHFDLRELDGFCYYPIEMDYKCALRLAMDKIAQIPYCCKVGETHLKHSNFLNQD
jgi:hypothetical protein